MLVRRSYPALAAMLLTFSAFAAPSPAPAAAPATAAKPAAAPATPPGGAAKPTAGPVQKLFDERKYQEALVEAERLRKLSGKPLGEPDDEFFAARSENALKLFDAARKHFQDIARTYPSHERGGGSAIEATTVRLGQLEGPAVTPADKKIASESALELEATAKAYASTPDVASRAWYVAGNAWRTGGDDAKAMADYENARKITGSDYPAKATYMVGVLKARAFDNAGATALYTECLKRFPESTSAEKCRKGLARQTLIGSTAPPLSVETWLNSEPVDIAALKGNVVLVWFFATWCPHCKATMPEMADLVEKYRGKPFKIVGISNNMKDQTTELAKAFVADPQWRINWPAGIDRAGSTTIDWQAQGIPAAVLVDKKGLVRWADHPVYVDAAMIDKLLAE